MFSLWEIIFGGTSTFTWLGIILIVLAILGVIINFVMFYRFSLVALLAGLGLIFIPALIVDFFQSTINKILTLLFIAIVLTLVLLLGKKKK